ncbi:DNA cytosine methyltransferase [Sphingopyxis sp. J-6]|uniref:DNA cytosine methyltransferase n=1 Tax=Sphingopyxis sp. J-6 TaxID=3122054 RepID=UPI0039841803
MTLTALDLFSGAGGLTLGLQSAGFKVVGAFDSWRPAVASYRLNFREHPCFLEDVSNLTSDRISELGLPNHIDLVAGGPPCQGFSVQRIGEDEDSRNDLILAFGRVVIGTNARAFMMENVRGLLGARGRAVLARFVTLMESSGYCVEIKTLDAADFGVPQNRQRVFVVGLRSNNVDHFSFPTPTADRWRTVQEALQDLPPASEIGSISPPDPLHVETPLSPLNRQRIAIVPPGGGFEDLPVELRANCHKNGAARIGHRSVYGRLHPERPAGTITAMFDSFTRGRFGHPNEPRNLTLREGARLQSFPDSHLFVGSKREIVKQIGNAIPYPLAASVARSIALALEGEKDGPARGHRDPEFAIHA